jgi:hydroxymethylpyrimidine/phosphomethylpyrimidine kinase
MGKLRPVVLSIAGLDPCSGAGLTADIKTFEANRVYGLGIASAITYQHDTFFQKVDWTPLEKIMEQVELQKQRFHIPWIKIGLIENLNTLDRLLLYLRSELPAAGIVWDPVLKASTGYLFHPQTELSLVQAICKNIFVLTPNVPEAIELEETGQALENAKRLSVHCHVYLKGGHTDDKKGKDFLITKEGKCFSFNPKHKQVYEKHGSGCVFSAALTANLAKSTRLHRACLKAKDYTAAFLNSNTSLLGYHKL